MTSSSEQPPKEKGWNNANAKSDSEFLAWCADRFELHYGESPNNQYITRLREIASRPHPAPAQGLNFRPECPHHMYYEEYMGEPEKHICNKRKEWETEAARKAREDALKELGTILNSRIAKMEIICSKSKTPLREGILMAYREIEGWERQQTNAIRNTAPQSEQEQPR